MKSRWINAVLAVLLAAFASMALAQETDAAPARFPRVGAYEVLKCDFHNHTKNSDGDLTSVERVDEAVKNGYDAIAITDHGSFKSYEEALPRANELGLVLIRGMETGLEEREHLVALNLDPSYQPKDPHKWALTDGQPTVFYQQEWPKLAKDAHAFVIYAHPHMGLSEPVLWAIKQGLVHGIEVKNGVVGKDWNTVYSHGTWIYPQAIDWAIEHNLTLFANSDMHETRNAQNSPATLVLAEKRSVEGVMDALRAGRTIAWFDGMLWGKQEVLAQVIESAVSVSADGAQVIIENKSPAALTAALQTETPDATTVSLQPGDRTVLPMTALGGELTIRWENLWVSSTKNLETTHKLTPAATK
ncbi:MAG: PHP domain-containing protein [Candidatus Hydrogenedentes bacterium]|nr:PHP domain-containing protein [Candidatus Hydrogenedentota bacterium]